MLKRSTACLPLPLSKLLRSKISEIVHPSLVQVPLQYTAICSSDISLGCIYMVNLICHYQWVHTKAAVSFQNTNGNIYTAKRWDGMRNRSDYKKPNQNKTHLFFFLARLLYSLISLLSQLIASPTNPGARTRKSMTISSKRGVKAKHLFWQQPTLQADKAVSDSAYQNDNWTVVLTALCI